jgi:hypothetical protein
MRIIKILILNSFISFIGQSFSQDFNECKVDFFLLESQESFDYGDNGKEYVLILDNVPNYEVLERPGQTLKEAQDELSSKLKDNLDYNKNNPIVRDSLIKYYTELEHKIGANIIWWEKVRNATEDESKEYKKRLKAYNKKVIYCFQTFPDGSRGYGNYWDPSIPKPEFIDSNTIVKNDIIFRKNQKRIRDDFPIFWIQSKDSSLVFIYKDDNREYNFPVGTTPIFDLFPYKNSKFILSNEKQGIHSSMWKLLVFIVDDKYKLAMYNFKFNPGQYEPTKDYSIDILYDKKKLAKIDEFLSSLKSKELVIQTDGEEFINPTISDISFNLNAITISFTSNGESFTKEFEGYSDPNYHYDSGWPDRRSKQIYNFPIYYTDCYSKKLEDFNTLNLRGNYINDPKLKNQLFNALTSSPDWLNYSIEKVILTINSQWVIVTNKYTGLKESRFVYADVYVKSNKTGKCYLQKDVYFTQKLDPFNEYVYYIFVSVPQILEPYPCNLN